MRKWRFLAFFLVLLFLLSQKDLVSAKEIATLTRFEKTTGSSFEEGTGLCATLFNRQVYTLGAIVNAETDYYPQMCLFKIKNGAETILHNFGTVSLDACLGMPIQGDYMYFSAGGILWKMDRKEKITRVFQFEKDDVPTALYNAPTGTLVVQFLKEEMDNHVSPETNTSIQLFNLKDKKLKMVADNVLAPNDDMGVAVNKAGDRLVYLENFWRREAKVVDPALPDLVRPVQPLYFASLKPDGVGEKKTQGCLYLNDFLILVINGAWVGFDEKGKGILLYGNPEDSDAPQIGMTQFNVGEDGAIYGRRYFYTDGEFQEEIAKITIPTKYHSIVSKKGFLDPAKTINLPD